MLLISQANLTLARGPLSSWNGPNPVPEFNDFDARRAAPAFHGLGQPGPQRALRCSDGSRGKSIQY
jgi:hypothetical protein